ncbi:hypothetical protein PTXU04_00058 [Escherichia phage PTXU04]|uniref:Uncharacterized protein n=1 Tax=Escherichia phage PTXU04 TaxID=2508206 RepID=A0A482MU09_9CAUD|nr:hypothetical protein HOV50_gp58 [Escherichia phage PTXU04]QBQ76672.1 hypothetical protein PTXU04_00058 [Escherichia phage PTXU04]
MKTVNYYGHDVDVPDNATHLAADSDGTVYAFVGEPKLRNFIWWPEDGLLSGIGTCFDTDCPQLELPPGEWRDSLKEIKP